MLILFKILKSFRISNYNFEFMIFTHNLLVLVAAVCVLVALAGCGWFWVVWGGDNWLWYFVGVGGGGWVDLAGCVFTLSKIYQHNNVFLKHRDNTVFFISPSFFTSWKWECLIVCSIYIVLISFLQLENYCIENLLKIKLCKCLLYKLL